MKPSWLMMLCVTFVAGCAAEVEDDGVEVQDDGAEERAGSSAAAIIGNGVRLNGVRLNGVRLNGVRLNGVRLNGVTLSGVALNGTSFTGTQGTAKKSGTALVGAVAEGILSNGATIDVRFNAIQPSADPEILWYDVVYRESTSAGWKPICGTTLLGAPIRAIPLAGRWDESEGTATGGSHIDDPTVFSLACEGSAIEKCVSAGYKPWKSVTECKSGVCKSQPLRYHHQACTRMIRADYCGDGKSHTMEGVPINVWDPNGIQQRDSVDGSWTREAEWGSEGAVCIKDVRISLDGLVDDYVDAQCPDRRQASFSCFSSTSTFFAGYGFSTALDARSLIREEFDKSTVLDLLAP